MCPPEPVGVRIVPLRTTDIGTTDSADASRKESGCCWMFFMWKVGHAATLCPNLNESFPFMQPGWRAEKTPGGGGGGGGFIMIPPRVSQDRRRTENGD